MGDMGVICSAFSNFFHCPDFYCNWVADTSYGNHWIESTPLSLGIFRPFIIRFGA